MTTTTATIHIHVRDIHDVRASVTLDSVTLTFGSGHRVFLYGTVTEQRALLDKLYAQAETALAELETQRQPNTAAVVAP